LGISCRDLVREVCCAAVSLRSTSALRVVVVSCCYSVSVLRFVICGAF